MVDRYRVEEDGDLWNPQHDEAERGEYVRAADYDALAASVDRLTSDKARLAADYANTVQANAEVANINCDLNERIRALEAALRKIGYEPIGHAEATEREVLQAIVDIARSALETFDEQGAKDA